jgi:hypothetical protein
MIGATVLHLHEGQLGLVQTHSPHLSGYINWLGSLVSSQLRDALLCCPQQMASPVTFSCLFVIITSTVV